VQAAVKTRLVEDIDEAREIHGLAFAEDLWVGDHHTFWAVYDRKRVVGFCSAVVLTEMFTKPAVYLSRAAVAKSHWGRGVQRSMIATRCMWGIDHGAKQAVTYTLLRNYPSIVNLLNAGFKFYTPSPKWDWVDTTRVHYFRKDL
jgi:GNAT superfamily N-acetyltransferase